MRASDADRQRVIAALQRHTEAGRLTLEEFSERATEVYASRTLGELATLTRDLPAEAPTPAPAPARSAAEANARHLAFAFAAAVIVLVLLGLLMALR